MTCGRMYYAEPHKSIYLHLFYFSCMYFLFAAIDVRIDAVDSKPY